MFTKIIGPWSRDGHVDLRKIGQDGFVSKVIKKTKRNLRKPSFWILLAFITRSGRRNRK